MALAAPPALATSIGDPAGQPETLGSASAADDAARPGFGAVAPGPVAGAVSPSPWYDVVGSLASQPPTTPPEAGSTPAADDGSLPAADDEAGQVVAAEAALPAQAGGLETVVPDDAVFTAVTAAGALGGDPTAAPTSHLAGSLPAPTADGLGEADSPSPTAYALGTETTDEADGALDPAEADFGVMALTGVWFDATTEWVYAQSVTDSTPVLVGNATDLTDAIGSAGAYDDAKPYVIYLSGGFDLPTSISFSALNLELRYSGATPGTTDGNAVLTTSSNDRHFKISGTAAKLTLTGVTLDGGIAVDNPNYALFNGGIDSTANTFTFNGNIAHCRSGITRTSPAIAFANGTHVNVTGGKLWENSEDDPVTGAFTGGAIGPSSWVATASYVDISGDTQIVDNRASAYGGGVVLRQGTLTLRDNVVISGNSARVGGGVVIRETGTINIQDNAVISGNKTIYGTNNTVVPPGTGGGVAGGCGGGAVVINVSDNAQIINNLSERSGGGISIGFPGGTQAGCVLNLYGGTISGNVAAGTSRDITGNVGFDHVTGGGGGIYAAFPSQINIPADSSVSFADNNAGYLGLTPIGSDGVTPSTYQALFPLDVNYKSHIVKDFSTANSAGFPAPYDNLYNNYDIAVPNNSPQAYGKLNVIADDGGSVTKTVTTAGQDFYDLFQGHDWLGLKVGATAQMTATAAPGYEFTGWTLTSTELDATAAGLTELAAAIPTASLTNPTVTINGMPPADVTLQAGFIRVYPAQLDGLTDVKMTADLVGGSYTPPVVPPVEVINTGDRSATSVSLGLSNFELSGLPYSGPVTPFTLSGGASTVDPSGTSTWSLLVAGGLTQAGLYTADMTLTYQSEGAGPVLSQTVQVAFALVDTTVPLVVVSNLDFGQVVGSGYTVGTSAGVNVPARQVEVENLSDAATQFTIELAGPGASAFTLATGAANIGGRPDTDASWTIVPVTGLDPGVYMTQLQVEYLNGSTPVMSSVAQARFEVLTPATLTVTPSTVDLGQQDIGYAMSPVSPVTVINSGTAEATITMIGSSLGSSSRFTVISGAGLVTPGGTNAAWSITPKTGLPVGVYTETFTLTYTHTDTIGSVTDTTTFTTRFVVGTPVTVTWHLNDGTTNTAGDPGEVQLGDTIPAAPTGITQTGYALSGWANTPATTGGTVWVFGSSGTTVSVANGAITNGDGTYNLDLYARWTPKTGYVVTYNLNYDGASGGPADQTGLAWTATGLLPTTTVTRLGWNLTGWFTTASTGGTQVTGSTVFNTLTSTDTAGTTVTLYARWTVKTGYAVTYNLNYDGATGGPADQTGLAWTATGLLPSTTVTQTGYNLTGWFTTPATGGSQVTGSTVFNTLTSTDTAGTTVTLYARWTPKTGYAVTYNLNYDGATGAPANQTGLAWTATSLLPTTTVTRLGWNLTGWFTTPATGGSQVTGTTAFNALTSTDTAGTTVTLYARWTVKTGYVITYDLNYDGATGGPTDQTGLAWTATGLLPSTAVTRTGWNLTGWFTTPVTGGAQVTGTTAFNTLTSTDTAGTTVTLYARWGVNSGYGVHYDLNYDGATGGPTDQAGLAWTATGLIPTSTVSRLGWNLTGWFTTPTTGGSQVTGTTVFSTLASTDTAGTVVTLYARWTVKTGYQVHYDLNYTGASGGPANQTGLDWTATGLLPSGTVSRTGWSLTGWFTTASTGGSQVTGTTVFNTLTSVDTAGTTVTLYARWADVGLPSASVSYHGTPDWAMGSQLGYGLYFATPLAVTITGGDAQSGVARVDYLTTTGSFAGEAAALVWGNDPARVWTGQTGTSLTFTLAATARAQLCLFVRVTDNAGNTVVAFDSMTLYTNSTQTGVSGQYTMGSSSPVSVDATLNGNTIAQIVNTTTGLAVSSSAYSVNPTGGTGGAGSIALTSTYLAGLAAGTYTFTVTYNPLGVTYNPPEPPDARNQAPATTSFTIQVVKQTQPALTITGLPDNLAFTYGDPAATIGVTGGAGTGQVAWTMTPTVGTNVFVLNPLTSPTGGATLTVGDPGQVTLQATKAADAAWLAASTATVTVTVVKATPVVTLTTANRDVYGDQLTLTASVGKVGTGLVPTGYVEFWIDNQPLDVNPVLLNATGVATHTVSDTSGLDAGDHTIEARYTGNAYYKAYGPTKSPNTDIDAKDTTTLTVGKASQTITITPPGTKTWGDPNFTLALATPGAGTGAVTWAASPSGILAISGNTATITGTGTVTVTATKAADIDYNQTAATTNLTVSKANPIWGTPPTSSNLTYGQFLNASTLSGGIVTGVGSHASDTVTGTMTWNTPAVIPDVTTILGALTNYPLTFTPTGIDATRYNTLLGATALTVGKATPTIGTPPDGSPPVGTPILPIPHDTLGDSTITGGTTTHVVGDRPVTVPGVWTWNTPSTAWADTDIGHKTAPATFTPTDTDRYLPATTTVKVDVYSPVTIVSTPPVPTGIKYGQAISVSTLDATGAVVQADNGTGTHPITGTWAWTTPATRATNTGTYTAQATFTPTDLAPDPLVAGEGYVPTTINIGIPVAPATPILQTVTPPDVVYGQALSVTPLEIYQVIGVFDETIPGLLQWTDPAIIPSDVLGETGHYTTTALFTPTPGDIGDNYTTATFPVTVHVIPDVVELTHEAIDVVTPLMAALHRDNYTTDAVQAVTQALTTANLARADLDATQAYINATLHDLEAVLAALIQDHPLLDDNRPDGITAPGQDLTLRFKGDILDVVALTITPTDPTQSGPALTLTPQIGHGYQIHTNNPTGDIVGTITPGSAIIHLEPALLDTLPNTTYTLTITFTDNYTTGTGTTTLTINRAEPTTTPTPDNPTTNPTNPGPTSPTPRHNLLPTTGTNTSWALTLATLLATTGITLLTWGTTRIRRNRQRSDP